MASATPTNAEVLQHFRSRSNNKQFTEWLVDLVPKAKQVKTSTLISRIDKLQKLKTKLSKNKRHDDLENILIDQFDVEVSVCNQLQDNSSPEGCFEHSKRKSSESPCIISRKKRRSFEDITATIVNTSLIQELNKSDAEKNKLLSENRKLQSKLQKANVRTKNQEIERKKKIIQQKKDRIKNIEIELKREKEKLKKMEKSLQKGTKKQTE